MKVFMAGIEHNTKGIIGNMPDNYIDYGLVSYYYLRNDEQLELILTKVKSLLIDSGAHSFQHGKKVDFDAYTNEYKDFVARHTNNPKIIGFFEMDIDNVVGYNKVLEYQKSLNKVSDKIIPVWHKNRGINDFYNMLEQYREKRVSVTGFRNNDITDAQYNLFINAAHEYKCDIHLLGMTRFEFMKNLKTNSNDSADSSTWAQTGIFGGFHLTTPRNTLYRFRCLEGTKVKPQTLVRLNSLLSVYHQKAIYKE
jgi:hypothetical protein